MKLKLCTIDNLAIRQFCLTCPQPCQPTRELFRQPVECCPLGRRPEVAGPQEVKDFDEKPAGKTHDICRHRIPDCCGKPPLCQLTGQSCNSTPDMCERLK